VLGASAITICLFLLPVTPAPPLPPPLSWRCKTIITTPSSAIAHLLGGPTGGREGSPAFILSSLLYLPLLPASVASALPNLFLELFFNFLHFGTIACSSLYFLSHIPLLCPLGAVYLPPSRTTGVLGRVYKRGVFLFSPAYLFRNNLQRLCLCTYLHERRRLSGDCGRTGRTAFVASLRCLHPAFPGRVVDGGMFCWLPYMGRLLFLNGPASV